MKTLGRALTDPTHEKYGTWQSVITFFILASCLSLALETVPEIAEKYHQEYFAKHADAPYCQIVIAPKLEKLQKRFAELLK